MKTLSKDDMVCELDSRCSDLRYTRRRYFIDRFLFRLPHLAPQGGLLLDVGGNKIRKRGQFNYEGMPYTVVYADISPEKKPDVQADAVMLPFSNDVFDIVICSEVLEHIFRPEAAVREIHRVLKPEGLLLVTAPFLMQMHAHPEDFGRFTDTFWERLLNETGFSEIVIESQGSFWIVVIEMLIANFLRKADAGDISRPLCHVLSSLLILARKKALQNHSRCQSKDVPSFTTGFGISCKKPAAGLGSGA